MRGIDYTFYRELLAGKYEDEVNKGLSELYRQRSGVFTDALAKA